MRIGMKILHLVPSYLPAYKIGGPIWSVHNLNKELVKMGHKVTVVTTNTDAGAIMKVPVGQAVDVDGVRVFYFPVRFPRFWYYSPAARSFLKQHMAEYDLIHITSVFLYFSYIGAKLAGKFGKPYIVSPRGSLMREPLKMKSPLKKRLYLAFVEKKALANAAALHFTAAAEKDEYERAGLPLRSSFVVPNALDASVLDKLDPTPVFRKKFRLSDRKKLVLFLSRLNWKKGLDTLVPAFKKVVEKEPETILVLVGSDDDGYKKNVQSLINNYKLQDSILFTGMLLGGDKAAAFRDSNVFVLPSYSENFGMAVVEAMYFGLPVIVTKGVGISPEIEEAGAGLVINKNEDELAAAILKILKDPDLARKLGAAGKNLVQKEFAMPAVADKFIEVYTELIR